MKNRFAVLAVSIFIYPVFSNAQPPEDPEWWVGVDQSIVLSFMSFDYSVDQVGKWGYSSGLVIKQQDFRRIGFAASLLYAGRGIQQKKDAGSFYNRSMSFLQLPFLTQISIIGTHEDAAEFYIQAGPFASILIREQARGNIADSSYARPFQLQRVDSRGEFGLVYGLGIFLDSNLGDFELDLTVFQGLTNFFKEASINSDGSKCITIRLGMTYFIALPEDR